MRRTLRKDGYRFNRPSDEPLSVKKSVTPWKSKSPRGRSRMKSCPSASRADLPLLRMYSYAIVFILYFCPLCSVFGHVSANTSRTRGSQACPPDYVEVAQQG